MISYLIDLKISKRNTLRKNKLLLIGDFNGSGDEGLSQISKNLSELLKISNDIKRINTSASLTFVNILSIVKFQPNIIHYITGPTIKSLIILLLLNILLLNKPKIVISATRPFIPKRYFNFLKYFPIDLVFTQATKWEKVFTRHRINTVFLPNPIKIEKFCKSKINKNELKIKYNLPLDKKIILHVGHIKTNRNMDFFLHILPTVQTLGYEILIVNSTSFKKDIKLINELKSAGIMVIDKYIENLEEIYSISDYYVFPVNGLEKDYQPTNLNEIGVIDMPLTILEALSIGLPVLSTEIDSIDQLFKNYNLDERLIKKFKNEKEFIELLSSIDNVKVDNNSLRSIIDEQRVINTIKEEYIKNLNHYE